MAIISRLDRVLADRKMSVNELAEHVGISPTNVSRIKTGRIKAIRFSTMDGMCEALHCQPGDLFEYMPRSEEHTSELQSH